MFAKHKLGAECIHEFGSIHAGAIVPEVNELYSQVEEWLASNKWVDTPLVVMGEGEAKTKINNLYDSSMSSLQSKYPQTEINTFARKSVAANDFIENNKNAKDSNIYLLAKIDAVVNGVSPLSMGEIAEEIENINDSGWETIQDRAIKILSAEHQYDFYLAKIEQMRNSALDQLSETDDNTSIVESLTEAYKQLEG